MTRLGWTALCLAACTHASVITSTTVETPLAVVTWTDRWSPTSDCGVGGKRSMSTALLIGRALALADRAGLPLTPVYSDRLPRVVVVATRSTRASADPKPSDREIVISVDADDHGHAIVRYAGLGHGSVYCAILEDGHLTIGQPPLDVLQIPTPFVIATEPEPEDDAPSVDGCDPSTPVPPVVFSDYYATNEPCQLAGAYDEGNFCLVARALASKGVSWTETVVLTQPQSRTLIIDLDEVHGLEGRLIVNPRASGEVSTRTPNDLKYYCVSIAADRVDVLLWKHIIFD